MDKKLISYFITFMFLMVVSMGCGPSGLLVQSAPASRRLRETQIQTDKGIFITDKIVVIDVDGFMINKRKPWLFHTSDNPVSLFVEKLEKARNDPDVKAVVLRLNSPGGTVAAADMMYHKLRHFKQQTGKPVVACMLDVAASGAYYLACGCDEIVAQPTTVTGSIGTIMQTFSFAGTMDKLGVKAVTIKSGQLKDIASPFHDLSEKERIILQEIIMQFYDQFLDVVRRGRKQIQQDRLQQLADGRVFTAPDALKEGLIDRIGYPSDCIELAKEMAAVKRARVVIYHRPVDYKPNVYGTAASSFGQVGALINFELPDWLTSYETQFLYLWQPGAD